MISAKIISPTGVKNVLQARVGRSPAKFADHALFKQKMQRKNPRPLWALGMPYKICVPPGG